MATGTLKKKIPIRSPFVQRGSVTLPWREFLQFLLDGVDETFSGTAGEGLSAGDICYLKSDCKFYKTSNEAYATTAGALAIATATIAADADGLLQKPGTDYTYPGGGLTPGATYYVG